MATVGHPNFRQRLRGALTGWNEPGLWGNTPPSLVADSVVEWKQKVSAKGTGWGTSRLRHCHCCSRALHSTTVRLVVSLFFWAAFRAVQLLTWYPSFAKLPSYYVVNHAWHLPSYYSMLTSRGAGFVPIKHSPRQRLDAEICKSKICVLCKCACVCPREKDEGRNYLHSTAGPHSRSSRCIAA